VSICSWITSRSSTFRVVFRPKRFFAHRTFPAWIFPRFNPPSQNYPLSQQRTVLSGWPTCVKRKTTSLSCRSRPTGISSEQSNNWPNGPWSTCPVLWRTESADKSIGQDGPRSEPTTGGVAHPDSPLEASVLTDADQRLRFTENLVHNASVKQKEAVTAVFARPPWPARDLEVILSFRTLTCALCNSSRCCVSRRA